MKKFESMQNRNPGNPNGLKWPALPNRIIRNARAYCLFLKSFVQDTSHLVEDTKCFVQDGIYLKQDTKRFVRVVPYLVQDAKHIDCFFCGLNKIRSV